MLSLALKNDLGGIEFLGGVPGSVGGGMIMNAGTYLGEFKLVNLRQRRLEIRMADDANNTNALASVFMTLADNKVTVVSIRSVGMQTEQAFLDLFEEEESRGLARAYKSAA